MASLNALAMLAKVRQPGGAASCCGVSCLRGLTNCWRLAAGGWRLAAGGWRGMLKHVRSQCRAVLWVVSSSSKQMASFLLYISAFGLRAVIAAFAAPKPPALVRVPCLSNASTGQLRLILTKGRHCMKVCMASNTSRHQSQPKYRSAMCTASGMPKPLLAIHKNGPLRGNRSAEVPLCKTLKKCLPASMLATQRYAPQAAPSIDMHTITASGFLLLD